MVVRIAVLEYYNHDTRIKQCSPLNPLKLLDLRLVLYSFSKTHRTVCEESTTTIFFETKCKVSILSNYLLSAGTESE